jgi:hypothetical protein
VVSEILDKSKKSKDYEAIVNLSVEDLLEAEKLLRQKTLSPQA